MGKAQSNLDGLAIILWYARTCYRLVSVLLHVRICYSANKTYRT